MLFNRGNYIGQANRTPRTGTQLDLAASTKDTVVVDFYLGPNCTTCEDDQRAAIRYRWDGARAVMLDPLLPDRLPLVDPLPPHLLVPS